MDIPFKRREFTTPGSDPTLVVEWTFMKLGSIIEFQNVYHGTGFLQGMDEMFLEWIHCSLEDKWWEDLVNQAGNDPADRRPY